MILQVAGFHQLLGESSQLGTPKWPTAFQERMNGNSQIFTHAKRVGWKSY